MRTRTFLNISSVLGSVALMAATPAAAQITTTSNNNATQLGAALQGSGITFTSATLTGNSGNGTFANGTSALGIANGVVLTTGGLGCVTASNTTGGCSSDASGTTGATGNTTGSTLTLGFTATSTDLFFNYVFGSEEYPEYVNSFNDTFSLTLTGANYAGVNLAQLPNNGGVVSINNVNAASNSNYYVSNTPPVLPISFDGLTKVLTASANNLVVGSNYSLAFSITDQGDTAYDSAVFIQGGSVGTVTPPPSAVPEPATWAMMLIGFGGIGATMRRRKQSARIQFA